MRKKSKTIRNENKNAPDFPEELTAKFIHLSQENLLETLQATEKKLAKIGPVNLRASRDRKELREKITFLELQETDLTESLETLRRAVSKIDRLMIGNLQSTFAQTDKAFQKYFEILFPGGQGNIEREGSDWLDCGFRIRVSPEGKKLPSMSSMSGGEKALVSLALILSLFENKKSRVCILDEVDAPFDESNSRRFFQAP